MTITTAMVQELRERTGVGIGDCKKALVESGGDIEAAITFLRKKGMASAAKKQERSTNEGMIASAASSSHVAIVEVNAETDFVVKNAQFQEFIANIAQEIAETQPETVAAFMKQKYSKDPSITIDEYRGTIVQMIGENIQISRLLLLPKESNQSIGVYSHLGGKLLVAVTLNGSSKQEALARDIAMHTAAAAPEYLSPQEVPAEKIESEKEIIKSQIANKPANIIDKIVDGKLNAFYKEQCLTHQPYIRDDSITVEELVKRHAKESAEQLEIANFTRWSVSNS